jgi:hypothetical protein
MWWDKDLKGMIIDQRAKDSKSTEIDGQSRFCGHRFLLKQHLFGDKRCIYCGKWFHWSFKDIQKAVDRDNVDSLNVDNIIEPLHCGNSMCADFHKLCEVEQIKKMKEREKYEAEYHYELFKSLKRRKIIL